MERKKIIEIVLFLGLLVLIVLGIVSDYWTSSGEYLGFVDEGAHMGLWDLCVKLPSYELNVSPTGSATGYVKKVEIPSMCVSASSIEEINKQTLNGVRSLACIGSALFMIGYLISMVGGSCMVSGLLSIFGAIMIIISLVVWKYVYVADFPEEKLKYGWNGASFNIMVAVGVLGLCYGCYQIYCHYSDEY